MMASDEKKNSVPSDSTDIDEKKHKKNKKEKEINGVVIVNKKGPSAKPVIMGIVLVILIAATVGAITYFIENKPEMPSETAVETTVNTVQSGNLLDTPAQATAPLTTVPEVTETKVVLDSDAETFASGTYTLDGTVYVSGGSGGYAVSIASSRTYTEISGLCSGMWLGVMKKNGQKYLLDNESKTYIDFTEEAYEKLGVDKIPYDVDLPGDISSCEFKRADVLLNNDSAVCYGVDYNGGHADIYTVNGVLKQFVIFAEDYTPLYEVIVNSISPAVPSDRITASGFAKSTSIFSFFSALAS